MTTIIWTSAAVLALFAILATHEAGHALAMRRYGIPIEEAGIGLPFAPRLVLPPTRRRPFRISVSPWLLAAYVTPAKTHADRINELPYIDQAWISGAGITVNAITGCTLGAVLSAIGNDWPKAAILGGIAAAVAVRPRHFCAYLAPALSIPVAVLTAWTLFATIGQPEGPVGTGQALHTTTLFGAASVTATIALGLALLNLLPFHPFDGGRIVASVAERWGGGKARLICERSGAALAISLVGYCISSDLWWIVR